VVDTIKSIQLFASNIVVVEPDGFAKLVKVGNIQTVMHLEDSSNLYLNGTPKKDLINGGLFHCETQGQTYICEDLEFQDFAALDRSYNVYAMGATGYSSFIKFLETFQMGLDSKKQLDLYNKSGFNSVPEFLNAQSRGFDSKADIEISDKCGFNNGLDYKKYKNVNDSVQLSKSIEMAKIQEFIGLDREALFNKLLEGKIKLRIDGDLLIIESLGRNESFFQFMQKLNEAWELELDLLSLDWSMLS
jgi:hypothetical protein